MWKDIECIVHGMTRWAAIIEGMKRLVLYIDDWECV